MKIPYPYTWIILSGVTAAAVLAILLSINGYHREYFETSDYIANLPIPKAEAALIELDFGDGKRRIFRGAVNKDVYPLDTALNSAAENGNFSFKIKDGALAELAGISGEWNIYRNGEQINTSLRELNITGGDRYTFRHKK